MADLKSKKLIYLKAVLFLGILILAGGFILSEAGSWKVAICLAL